MPDRHFGSNPFQPLNVVLAALRDAGLSSDAARALIKECIFADRIPWRRRELKRGAYDRGNPVWEDPPRGSFDPNSGDELDFERSLIKSGPGLGFSFSVLPGDTDEQPEAKTGDDVTRDRPFKFHLAAPDYEIQTDANSILMIYSFSLRSENPRKPKRKGQDRVREALRALPPERQNLLRYHGVVSDTVRLLCEKLPDLKEETIRRYLTDIKKTTTPVT